MNRVLFSIGPIVIYWYSFMIFLSILIGLCIVKKEVVKTKVDKSFIFDLIFYLIPVCIIGARIYYVIFNYSVYRGDFLSVFKIWEGGLAIYGAVISGIIFTIYYCKKKKQSILVTLDILAPCLILGQAFGRWGNFFNQEAYGMITSYSYLKKLHLPEFIISGMYINDSYRIPTFLYESLWNVMVFVILIIVRNKIKYKKEGIIVCLYFVLYSFGRFFIEGFRTDSLYLFNIRISQLVSVFLFIIGIIGIIIINKRDDKNEKI